MRKLDRHIGSAVIWAILVVIGLITGLASLFSFIDQLKDIKAGFTMLDALYYVWLTIPRRAYDVLPMSALIGCLVGLGTLASNSELTVMRAAGVSLMRILWAVMKPLLLLMLIGVALAEYVVPWTESMAQEHRSLTRSAGKAQGSKYGLWHRHGDEFIHINTVRANGELLGVTRYQFAPDLQLQQSSFAQRAWHEPQLGWQLENVVYTSIGEHSTEVRQVALETWPVTLEPKLLKTIVMDTDALPISGLWQYSNYLEEQGLNAASYRLAFWEKSLQPLVTAVLVLMAISFIFGPLRSVTLGQRVFTGVVIGFTLKILQDLLGPASQVFGFSPLLAVLFPAGLCALVGWQLLRRAA